MFFYRLLVIFMFLKGILIFVSVFTETDITVSVYVMYFPHLFFFIIQ